MYNPKIKKQFILDAYEEKTSENIGSFFNTTESLEAEFDKDLVYFTNQELALYFEQTEAYNTDTIRTKLTYVRNYRLWYNDNVDHCPVKTPIREVIGLIDFDKAYNKYFFFSIEEVLAAVDKDLHTSGKMYCPMFILAWHGLEKTECFNLKKADVQETEDEKLLVHTDKRLVTISHPRCVEILKEYMNTTSYILNEKTQTVYYEDNDVYFIRKYSTAAKLPDKAVAVKNSTFIPVRAGYEKTPEGKQITFKAIQMSGDMYRLYEVYSAGGDVFESVVKNNPGIDSGKARERTRIFEIYKKYR